MASRDVRYGIETVESQNVDRVLTADLEKIGFHAAFFAFGGARSQAALRNFYNYDNEEHLKDAQYRYGRMAMNGRLVIALAQDRIGPVGFAAVELVPIQTSRTKLGERSVPLIRQLEHRQLVSDRTSQKLTTIFDPVYEARLSEVNVLPPYQGIGIGGALVAAAFEPFHDDLSASADVFKESKAMQRVMHSFGFEIDRARPGGRRVNMGSFEPAIVDRYVSPSVKHIKHAVQPPDHEPIEYQAPVYAIDRREADTIHNALLDSVEITHTSGSHHE